MLLRFEGELVAKQTYNSTYELFAGKHGLVIASNGNHIGAVVDTVLGEGQLQLGHALAISFDSLNPLFRGKGTYERNGKQEAYNTLFYFATAFCLENNL